MSGCAQFDMTRTPAREVAQMAAHDITEPHNDQSSNLDAAMGYPAWRGFVSWAYSDDRMREAFTAQTGIVWPPAPKNGLSLLIDRATGAEEARAGAFAIWASEQWGEEHCPPLMRDAIAKKREGAN